MSAEYQLAKIELFRAPHTDSPEPTVLDLSIGPRIPYLVLGDIVTSYWNNKQSLCHVALGNNHFDMSKDNQKSTFNDFQIQFSHWSSSLTNERKEEMKTRLVKAGTFRFTSSIFSAAFSLKGFKNMLSQWRPEKSGSDKTLVWKPPNTVTVLTL